MWGDGFGNLNGVPLERRHFGKSSRLSHMALHGTSLLKGVDYFKSFEYIS